MELKDFVQQFAFQFEDTAAECFESATCFRNLEEWSSLMALTVMGMIDEEYGVSLSGAEMQSVNTIEEMFNLVQLKR